MKIINNLLGNHKESRDLKKDFLKIAIVNYLDRKSNVVHGRGVGKEKMSFKEAVYNQRDYDLKAMLTSDRLIRSKDDSLFQGIHDFNDDFTSRDHLREEKQKDQKFYHSLNKSETLYANLANNGSASANFDPIKSIQRVILREKPNILEACKPNP